MIKSIIAALAVSSALLAGSAFAQSCTASDPYAKGTTEYKNNLVQCIVTDAINDPISTITDCTTPIDGVGLSQTAQDIGIVVMCGMEPAKQADCVTDLTEWKNISASFSCFDIK